MGLNIVFFEVRIFDFGEFVIFVCEKFYFCLLNCVVFFVMINNFYGEIEVMIIFIGSLNGFFIGIDWGVVFDYMYSVVVDLKCVVIWEVVIEK